MGAWGDINNGQKRFKVYTDFDQPMACKSPISLSKYTATVVHSLNLLILQHMLFVDFSQTTDHPLLNVTS